MKYKLYNDDCMNILKTLPNKSVDLTIADIPYGEVNRKSGSLRSFNKYEADRETFNIDEFLQRVCMVTSGSVYIFCGIGQVSKVRDCLISYGLSTRLGIW